MAPLFLHFDDCEVDLLGDFSRLDHEAYGIYFADGSNPSSAVGTVIFSGVTFDYAIVACEEPDATTKIFCDADLGKIKSAITLGLGAAVASGQHMPAVIKMLLLLADTLGSPLGAKSVYWTPASVTTGFAYYSETIRQYANGAAFPALVTVAFDTDGDDCIRTSGLGWLAGQELLFERDYLPVNEAMRYVVRIVHDLATNGAVATEMEVPGMSGNERLQLIPDMTSGLLTARRKHVQNGVNSSG